MEGKPAVWVIASKASTGEEVAELLRKARLTNPIKVIETPAEFCAALHPGYRPPQLILWEVSAGDAFCWETLRCLREQSLEVRVIALIDLGSEMLLDRAYEAGIKTYLRRGFSFADFLERARALNLQFILGTQ